jgi:hypothetical protein
VTVNRISILGHVKGYPGWIVEIDYSDGHKSSQWFSGYGYPEELVDVMGAIMDQIVKRKESKDVA